MYIACTLLYLRDLIQVIDPETGATLSVERGYIHPGQPVNLPSDDPRLEIWLGMGAIAPIALESPTFEAISETPQE